MANLVSEIKLICKINKDLTQLNDRSTNRLTFKWTKNLSEDKELPLWHNRQQVKLLLVMPESYIKVLVQVPAPPFTD